MDWLKFFKGLVLGAIIVLILSASGIIRSLDGWIFDRLIPLASWPGQSSTLVLVVECRSELEMPQVMDLAQKLNAAGAGISVFTRDDVARVDPPERAALQRLNALVTDGSLTHQPPGDGIWRGVWPEGPSLEDTSPAMIGIITQQLGLAPPPDAFLLDFKVKREGFQVVDADRILAGDLPRSLVEGKVVLIGRKRPAEELITTSVHRGRDALSPALWQAAVIDCQLRGGLIRIAPPWVHWGFAVVLAGMMGLLSWRLKLDRMFWISIGGIVTALVVALVGVRALHWWLPPGGACVVLGMTGAMTARLRGGIHRAALRRTLRQLAVDLQERAEKDGFLTSASPWEIIESSLSQLFAFPHSFLLRADEMSGKLEAATDAGRTLCSTHFPEASLRLDQERFLNARRERGARLEDNLVVLPIGRTSRIFGFWVIQAPPEADLSQSIAYLDRLACMLEQREEWRARARPHLLEANDAAALQIHPLHDQLEGSIFLLDRASTMLEEALDAAREAVLVFDPCGKLIHASPSSVELLGPAWAELSKSPPGEIVAALSAVEPEEIRRALRFVSLNREEATFKAALTHLPGREYFVHLRALTRITGLGGKDTPGLPGLLLMIQDVTETARISLLKDELMERIFYQINNDFGSIVAASALLNDPRVSSSDRNDILSMISEKIEEVGGRMKETRQHLQTEFRHAQVERYPLSFQPVFNAARDAIAGDLETHQVTIDAAVSDYLQLILAAPKLLEDLLRAMLLTLAQDAREETKITVQAMQRDTELTVVMSNEGYGMPQEKLDQYLSDGADGHEILQTISDGLMTVAAWGGAMKVTSAVGSGISFEITFRSVI